MGDWSVDAHDRCSGAGCFPPIVGWHETSAIVPCRDSSEFAGRGAVRILNWKGPRRESADRAEAAGGLTSLLMTTSFMSANPPAERPAFVEIGEAVRTSMAALARVLGRAPRCAPIVTLIAFTGDGRGGRNERHRQQQQHGDGADEHARARVYRRAGGHVVD